MSERPQRRGWAGLLVADGISRAGTVMSALALPWFVLVTTGDAALTGLVAFAEMLPLVLVQGLGGPLIDRVGARRVAVVANLLAAAMVALIPTLHTRGYLGPGALLALVALVGAMRGAASCTYVLVPVVATDARVPLDRATGVYDGVSRTSQLLGAPLAGVLLATFSADLVLMVDAATFGIAAVILWATIPRTTTQPTAGKEPCLSAGTSSRRPPQEHPAELGEQDPSSVKETSSGYFTDLRAGLTFLRRDRTLVAIAAMVAITNLLDMAYISVLLPVWVHGELDDPLGLGLIMGVSAAGAIIGNIGYAWLGPRLPRRRMFAWSFLVGGAPRLLVLAAASTVAPVIAVGLLGGIGSGSLNPILGAVELERVPAPMRARVLGAISALAWAGMPLGGLLGGLAIGAIGLTPAILLFAAVYLTTTVAPFTMRAFRGFDRTPAVLVNA